MRIVCLKMMRNLLLVARRNWTKCVCGAKLSVKSGEKTCFSCRVKKAKD